MTRTPRRPHHGILSGLLSGPVGGVVPGGLAVLRYRATSGHDVELPVQAVRLADGFIVLAGRADAKTWWRAFRQPRSASLLTGGDRHAVIGRVVAADDLDAEKAAAAYTEVHPHVALTGGRLVRFSIVEPPLLDASDHLFGRWVRWTVAGELLGFVVPAIVGMVSAGWSSREAIPTMVAAGAVEGLLLGGAQAHALAPFVPGLRSGRFAVGTALAAALAYLLGMLPSALGPRLVEAPLMAVVLAGTVGGIVLLGSIGTAQWLELRRHVDSAWTWIATTAAAWLLGLAAFLLIAMPLWHPGQGSAAIVAIGLVAAGAMATTVAIVTGWALRRLLARRVGGSRPHPATP